MAFSAMALNHQVRETKLETHLSKSQYDSYKFNFSSIKFFFRLYRYDSIQQASRHQQFGH